MSHSGTEDKFLKTLFPTNMNNLKILDVGCGYGATGLYIRTRSYRNGWCHLIGVDPFPDYINLQQRMGIYDELYLGRGEELDKRFQPKSIDISICQHVIEHMRKNKNNNEQIAPAYKFLENLEKITRKRIIICTPHGYTESGALDDNEDNNHLSGWYPKDFEELGYLTKIVTKNVNSRLLQCFAKTVFMLQGKTWDNEVLVAWKDLEK